MIDVTLLKGFSASLAYFNEYAWTGLIDTVLDGPLKKKTAGNTVTWTDLRTDSEIKVFKQGAKVKKIEVKAEIVYGPDRGDVNKVLEVEFTGKSAPKHKSLIKEFDKIHKAGLTDFSPGYDDQTRVTDKDTWDFDDNGASNFFTGSSKADEFRMFGGEDYASASPGNDKYYGGLGDDSVSYAEYYDFGGIKVTKKGANLQVGKPDGSKDTLNSIESITGTNEKDKMTVKVKTDVALSGLDGNDRLISGSGDDVLVGGPGNDFLRGGPGDDVLVADTGYYGQYETARDTMQGDSGSDLFVISAGAPYLFGDSPVAIIKDFKNGQDFIGLVDMTFDELTFAKDGKNTEISYEGDVIAILKKVSPNQLDREDFHQDMESYFFTHLI